MSADPEQKSTSGADQDSSQILQNNPIECMDSDITPPVLRRKSQNSTQQLSATHTKVDLVEQSSQQLFEAIQSKETIQSLEDQEKTANFQNGKLSPKTHQNKNQIKQLTGKNSRTSLTPSSIRSQDSESLDTSSSSIASNSEYQQSKASFPVDSPSISPDYYMTSPISELLSTPTISMSSITQDSRSSPKSPQDSYSNITSNSPQSRFSTLSSASPHSLLTISSSPSLTSPHSMSISISASSKSSNSKGNTINLNNPQSSLQQQHSPLTAFNQPLHQLSQLNQSHIKTNNDHHSHSNSKTENKQQTQELDNGNRNITTKLRKPEQFGVFTSPYVSEMLYNSMDQNNEKIQMKYFEPQKHVHQSNKQSPSISIGKRSYHKHHHNKKLQGKEIKTKQSFNRDDEQKVKQNHNKKKEYKKRNDNNFDQQQSVSIYELKGKVDTSNFNSQSSYIQNLQYQDSSLNNQSSYMLQQTESEHSNISNNSNTPNSSIVSSPSQQQQIDSQIQSNQYQQDFIDNPQINQIQQDIQDKADAQDIKIHLETNSSTEQSDINVSEANQQNTRPEVHDSNSYTNVTQLPFPSLNQQQLTQQQLFIDKSSSQSTPQFIPSQMTPLLIYSPFYMISSSPNTITPAQNPSNITDNLQDQYPMQASPLLMDSRYLQMQNSHNFTISENLSNNQIKQGQNDTFQSPMIIPQLFSTFIQSSRDSPQFYPSPQPDTNLNQFLQQNRDIQYDGLFSPNSFNLNQSLKTPVQNSNGKQSINSGKEIDNQKNDNSQLQQEKLNNSEKMNEQEYKNQYPNSLLQSLPIQPFHIPSAHQIKETSSSDLQISSNFNSNNINLEQMTFKQPIQLSFAPFKENIVQISPLNSQQNKQTIDKNEQVKKQTEKQENQIKDNNESNIIDNSQMKQRKYKEFKPKGKHFDRDIKQLLNNSIYNQNEQENTEFKDGQYQNKQNAVDQNKQENNQQQKEKESSHANSNHLPLQLLPTPDDKLRIQTNTSQSPSSFTPQSQQSVDYKDSPQSQSQQSSNEEMPINTTYLNLNIPQKLPRIINSSQSPQTSLPKHPSFPPPMRLSSNLISNRPIQTNPNMNIQNKLQHAQQQQLQQQQQQQQQYSQNPNYPFQQVHFLPYQQNQFPQMNYNWMQQNLDYQSRIHMQQQILANRRNLTPLNSFQPQTEKKSTFHYPPQIAPTTNSSLQQTPTIQSVENPIQLSKPNIDKVSIDGNNTKVIETKTNVELFEKQGDIQVDMLNKMNSNIIDFEINSIDQLEQSTSQYQKLQKNSKKRPFFGHNQEKEQQIVQQSIQQPQAQLQQNQYPVQDPWPRQPTSNDQFNNFIGFSNDKLNGISYQPIQSTNNNNNMNIGASSLEQKTAPTQIDVNEQNINLTPSGFIPRCFHCSQFGHLFNDCPLLKYEGVNTTRYSCYRCGEHGHHSNNCPNEDRRICFICKSKGHIQRDCPFRFEKQGQFFSVGSSHLSDKVESQEHI